MSDSFDFLLEGMTQALRAHVLPKIDDEFARGQVFAIIYSLNILRLGADWSATALRRQVDIQDDAFAKTRRLTTGIACPEIPTTPRAASDTTDAGFLEKLRDEGDRAIGALLCWATSGSPLSTERDVAKEVEAVLRAAIRDQLKVEIALTPPSMLNEIATGKES